jgi:hypothetical protein
MINTKPENNSIIFNFFDSVSKFINPDDEIKQKNIDNNFRDINNKEYNPLYDKGVEYEKTQLQLPMPIPPPPPKTFIPKEKKKDINYELQIKPIDNPQYNLIDVNMTEEEQKLFNSYSNSNYIILELNNEYYISPKLIDNIDLNSSKLNKSEFNEIYEIFNSILSSSNINLDPKPDSMFEKYEKIINSTTTITKELFIMNMAMLLMFNLHESFIQKVFSYLPYKYKTKKIQKGGTRLLTTLKNVFGQTLENGVEGIKNVGTFVRYGFRLDYLKASGGIDIFNSILSTTQNVLPLYLTIETLNEYFGSDESSENISMMTLMCYSMLMNQAYFIMKKVGTEVYYNMYDVNTQNYLNTYSYLNPIGLEKLINEFNFKLSKGMADEIKKILSSYLTSKYEASMRMIVKDLNQITFIQHSFQSQKGYLTDDLKQKDFFCIVCSSNFKYHEYGNQGYIHEELSDEEKVLLSKDITTIVSEEEKDAYKEALNKRINSFPCNQLIDVLISKGDIPTKYKFDSNYGTRATDNSGRYGEELPCSNCSFDVIKSQYIEGNWPLFYGQKQDGLFFSIDQLRDLIRNLCPKELETVSKEDYNSKYSSYFKINQINENNEKKIKYGAITEFLTVDCPTCSPDVNTRFQGLFTKDDINLLYLHCNACNTSFNGCDKGSPYILTIQDYDELIKISERNVCKFIQLKKLKERRIEGLVKVSMDKYKEIKKHQIRHKWSKLSQEITKVNEKQCPKCKRYNVLETGCSAIVCSCGETYCYVCSQKVYGHGGHDANHFLHSINTGTPILGGYYAVQCINVNFSIVDPDEHPGIHNRYTQTINGVETQIRPNPEYETVTKNTWKRYNYYRDRTKRLNPNASEENIQNLLYNGGDFWSEMNNIYYNFITDKAYKLGDVENDPDQLVNREIATFEEEFGTTSHDPIFDIKDIVDLIELKDIEEVINERERVRERVNEINQSNPGTEPVLVIEEEEEGTEEEKEGEREPVQPAIIDRELPVIPLEVPGGVEEEKAGEHDPIQPAIVVEEFPEIPPEVFEDEFVEYEDDDIVFQQVLLNIYQNRDEERIVNEYGHIQRARIRVEDRIQRVQDPHEAQLLNIRLKQIKEQFQDEVNQREQWYIHLQRDPHETIREDQRFVLHQQPTLDDLDGLTKYRRRLENKRKEYLMQKSRELIKVNQRIKRKWDTGPGSGAGDPNHIALPNRDTMNIIRNQYIEQPRIQPSSEPRFYANGIPLQNVEQIKEVKIESIEDRGFNKQVNDSSYDRIINKAIEDINRLSQIVPTTLDIQREINVLNIMRMTFEKKKHENVPYNYVDETIIKIFKDVKDVLETIDFLKGHNISHLVICKVTFGSGANAVDYYAKFYGNQTSQELFDIIDGRLYKKNCIGVVSIIPIEKIHDMVNSINLTLFDKKYNIPVHTILNDSNFKQHIFLYGIGALSKQITPTVSGGKKVLKHRKTIHIYKNKNNKKTKRIKGGGKLIKKLNKTNKHKLSKRKMVLKNKRTKRK